MGDKQVEADPSLEEAMRDAATRGVTTRFGTDDKGKPEVEQTAEGKEPVKKLKHE